MLPELALSLAGLRTGPGTPWPAGPRAAIAWVASLGYRSIQLDAAMPGLRPRELDRSARRGVASMLRQFGLACSGFDLWVPPRHFVDPAHQGRALDAVEASVILAADLRAPDEAPALSLTLPPDAAQAIARIAEVADRHGIQIAVHDPGVPLPESENSPVGIGVDPAELIRIGADVPARVAQAGRRLFAARLSDSDGTRRVNPGRGRLDRLAYAAALAVAGYQRPVIVDLRELEGQADAAAGAPTIWPRV